MNKILVFLFLSVQFPILAQEITVLTELDPTIQETSGLIRVNGKLVTHNDSGGKPFLYEFDSSKGKVSREVFINGAKNKDWEDICMDEKHIYIADIGNNRGNRTDLKIYRISKQEYLTNDTVIADTIRISYADQKHFGMGKFKTNYDAETLISMGDSLYIFSKNWTNKNTRVYSFPKQLGTYALNPIAEFNAKCLVTAGEYIAENKEIILCGYYFDKQHVIRITEIDLNNFQKSQFETVPFKVPENSSKQIEGLTWVSGYEYFICAEMYQNNFQVLYKMVWNP